MSATSRLSRLQEAWLSFQGGELRLDLTFDPGWLSYDRIERRGRERRASHQLKSNLMSWLGERRGWLSVSHSRGTALAAAWIPAWNPQFPTQGRVTGFGVDLECLDRRVSESVRRRLLEDGEGRGSLSGLHAWVIKEALFKSNPEGEGGVLSDYAIMGFNPQLGRGEAKWRKGKEGMEFLFTLVQEEGYVAAIAASFSPKTEGY